MSSPTTTTSAQSYPFSKIANFRDVSTSSSLLKPGLFYRSAAPDLATQNDQSILQQTYKIATIIDLRTDSEHLTRKQQDHQKASSPSTTAEAKIDKDEEVPPAADIPILNPTLLTPSEPSAPFFASSLTNTPSPLYKTLEINFNGPTYSSHLFHQLSYWHRAKLATLYALGYRTEAIKIIGENVMAERGLTGLAKDSLKFCRAEIKQIFDVLGNNENWPVMVHCTQGKDRTGLVVLLVLGVLGVSVEETKRDYLLSIPGLLEDLEERVEAISKIGLPREFAGCGEEWVGEVNGEIEREYGGFEKYLMDSCGVSKEQVEEVKRILRKRRQL